MLTLVDIQDQLQHHPAMIILLSSSRIILGDTSIRVLLQHHHPLPRVPLLAEASFHLEEEEDNDDDDTCKTLFCCRKSTLQALLKQIQLLSRKLDKTTALVLLPSGSLVDKPLRMDDSMYE